MNIIAVDDEGLSLSLLQKAISDALPAEKTSAFISSFDALEYARKNRVDVAFLDINMQDMDGLSLARKLTELHKQTNIIFVTGYSEYSINAFEQHASGYLSKPVRPDQIREEISNLRHPILGNSISPSVKEVGPYMLDYVTERVYFNSKDALLKPREFRLFALFANNPDMFFTPKEIYKKIWGDKPIGNISTVKVHISNLRKKLDMDREGHAKIKMEKGKGYYLDTTAYRG